MNKAGWNIFIFGKKCIFFLIFEIEVIFKYFTHAFNYSVKKKRNNERKFYDYFIKGKC